MCGECEDTPRIVRFLLDCGASPNLWCKFGVKHEPHGGVEGDALAHFNGLEFGEINVSGAKHKVSEPQNKVSELSNKMKLYNIPFKIFLNWQIRFSQKAHIIGHVISAVLEAAVLCSSCDEFSTDAATTTANQWLPGCAEDCVFTIQALHRCC